MKGKMTARERVEYLLDNIENAIEIGGLAGFEKCMPNMVDALVAV